MTNNNNIWVRYHRKQYMGMRYHRKQCVYGRYQSTFYNTIVGLMSSLSISVIAHTNLGLHLFWHQCLEEEELRFLDFCFLRRFCCPRRPTLRPSISACIRCRTFKEKALIRICRNENYTIRALTVSLSFTRLLRWPSWINACSSMVNCWRRHKTSNRALRTWWMMCSTRSKFIGFLFCRMLMI